MIIGLTGENCAGKGTTAEYLQKKGFYYLSLSDVVREELTNLGIELTRENLIKKANEMREKWGAGILAERISTRFEKDRNYVVDSIRNPSEVEVFQRRKDFILLYVTAPPELRFDRMKRRNRENDPKTYEAFLIIEKAESENLEKSKQNILATTKMANKKIPNEGDLPYLYDQVDKVLAEVSKEFRVERPSWDQYFMNIAKEVASRSNCVKRKVAAIIVKDKRIISTGYNGTPRGVRNCNEGGCPRCNNFTESGTKLEECLCSHGEENAIVQASYHGISIKEAILYTTFSPCLLCTKMIINAGIREVVYNAEYPLNETSFKLLKEGGIVLRKVKI
ncbi:AAA family ATPase [Candidatus Micrarchaeota archaeon]|nr:AAA family ATPase [Candidatus Micrarchaeota archaeon]